ncbi:RagB/SusD family nutrient uptake outer membrane protein [Niabella defluvii]|nr:RagB/SusD family nutrient uptake outer membrane protein [Niabella sp. I65]
MARKSGDLYDQVTIRLPEICLNKAEALAILGQSAEAIATLQELRKSRFKPEDLTRINMDGRNW